jgi:hypothetical protein
MPAKPEWFLDQSTRTVESSAKPKLRAERKQRKRVRKAKRNHSPGASSNKKPSSKKT